jgi:hypothetical protein
MGPVRAQESRTVYSRRMCQGAGTRLRALVSPSAHMGSSLASIHPLPPIGKSQGPMDIDQHCPPWTGMHHTCPADRFRVLALNRSIDKRLAENDKEEMGAESFAAGGNESKGHKVYPIRFAPAQFRYSRYPIRYTERNRPDGLAVPHPPLFSSEQMPQGVPYHWRSNGLSRHFLFRGIRELSFLCLILARTRAFRSMRTSYPPPFRG